MLRKAILNVIKAVVVGDSESSPWSRWVTGPHAEAWLEGDIEAGIDLMPETIDGALHIHAYGPIGGFFGIETEDFIQALRGNEKKAVVVHVDSPGGRLATGFAIRNMLMRRQADTTALVEGIAASAATIISAGCKRRVMAAGSRWVIHQANVVTMLNSSRVEELGKILKASDVDMASEYARIGDRDVDAYLEDMRTERWFTPQEAVDDGFASEESGVDALLDNLPNGGDTNDSNNPSQEAHMTEAEKAQFEALQAQLTAAQAERDTLKASVADSEKASALSDAAAAITAAKAEAKEAKDALAAALAKAQDAEVAAKVAKYPEAVQPLARIAIKSGDEAAIKALDATHAQATQSTQPQGNPNVIPAGAADGAGATSPQGATGTSGDPWAEFNALVSQTAATLGVTDKEARATVRKSAAGRAILGKIGDLREAGKANTVNVA